MANHPSRAWRRRATEAAGVIADGMLVGRPENAMVWMTRDQVRSVMVKSFQAGFEAGRLDVLNSRRKRKSDVHVG